MNYLNFNNRHVSFGAEKKYNCSPKSMEEALRASDYTISELSELGEDKYIAPKEEFFSKKLSEKELINLFREAKAKNDI